jgi:hypothetical protein
VRSARRVRRRSFTSATSSSSTRRGARGSANDAVPTCTALTHRPASARRPTSRWSPRPRRQWGRRAARHARRRPPARPPGGWRVPDRPPPPLASAGRPVSGSSTMPSSVFTSVSASAPASDTRRGHLDEPVGVGAELGPHRHVEGPGHGGDHLGGQVGIVGEHARRPSRLGHDRFTSTATTSAGPPVLVGGGSRTRRSLRPQMLATTVTAALAGREVLRPPVPRRPGPAGRPRSTCPEGCRSGAGRGSRATRRRPATSPPPRPAPKLDVGRPARRPHPGRARRRHHRVGQLHGPDRHAVSTRGRTRPAHTSRGTPAATRTCTSDRGAISARPCTAASAASTVVTALTRWTLAALRICLAVACARRDPGVC